MGKREPSVEPMTFINHTECHCIDRRLLSPNRHPPNTTITTNNSRPTAVTYPRPGINNPIDNNCQCVKYFKVFYQRIENDEDDEVVKSDRQLCRCDCESENVNCDLLKTGIDGFSIADRRCIVDKRCIRPTCEYGQYSIQNGRCPKLEEKLAGARNLSFD